MQRWTLLIFLLTALAWTQAQSEELVPVKLFCAPTVSLRPQAETNALAITAREVSEGEIESKKHLVEELVLSVERPATLSETSIQSFEAMNGGRVITYVEPPEEFGGAAGWIEEKVWDPVFAPEVVKIGKVKVTGGVVAAIKRKNPFCLLNPFVFGMAF